MAKYKPVVLEYIPYEDAETDPTLNPVIFLHGLMCSKENWSKIPEEIANKSKRKVYAYDARNHGDSEYTDESNFDINVQDLFHFMDIRKIQKAALVGASMGGITAVHAALRKPERVEMIFSLDIFVKKMPKEMVSQVIYFMNTWTDSVRSIPKTVPVTEIHKATVETVFQRMPQTPHIEKEKKALLRSKFIYRTKPSGDYEPGYNSDALLRALENHEKETQEASGQFEGPAYFLYSAESAFDVKSDEENIRTHFPRYELIEFENSSHHIHQDFPDEVVLVILTGLSAKRA